MKRNLVTLTIMILLLGVSTNINAQGKGQFRNSRAAMIEKLNLTDLQKDSFQELRFDHQEKVIDLKAEIQKNRLEIKKQMNADELDESKIMSLTKTNNELLGRIKESKMQMWFDMHNLLNDDQKEIFKNGMSSFGRMGKGMRGEGRSGGFQGRGHKMGGRNNGRGMPGGNMNPNCWRY